MNFKTGVTARLMGVDAPCLRCGDSLQECFDSRCCIGCNHATGTPRDSENATRGQLAAAKAASEPAVRTLEWLARQQDEKERRARADGAFDLAVCHQQYAAWWRAGTPIQRILGTGAVTLTAHVSDGLVISEGDALRDPESLYAVALAIMPDAFVVSELSTAEREVVAKALAAFDPTVSVGTAFYAHRELLEAVKALRAQEAEG